MVQLAQRSEEVFEKNPFSSQLSLGSEGKSLDELLADSATKLGLDPDEPQNDESNPSSTAAFDFLSEDPGYLQNSKFLQVPPVRFL
jgi:hypothetical protein